MGSVCQVVQSRPFLFANGHKPPSSIDSSGQTILCLDQLFLLDVGFVGFEVVYKFQIFLDLNLKVERRQQEKPGEKQTSHYLVSW